MGEVGTNSPDSPHVDLKMNGGINGNCEDDAEAMDVDAQDTSTEAIAKNVDNSDQPTSTNDSNNVMDTSGNSDGIELITSDTNNEHANEKRKTSTDSETCENGAADSNENCDQDPTADENSEDKIIADDVDDDELSKIVEDNDSSVKVSSDPLSADAEPIDDDKRTNQSRPQSTENGTSATITSSNDKNGQFKEDRKIPIQPIY